MAARWKTCTDTLSAEKIALLLAVGLVLGIFPVAACPTLLCLFASLVCRLNPVPLQLVNQVSTPLQLALFIPLARAGAWIVPGPSGFAGAVLQAVVAWFCICVPLGVLFYFALVYILGSRTRLALRQARRMASSMSGIS